MSIQEITTQEDCNTGEIHLHKEGVFWKAYQQSAYLFTQEVKAFNTSKRLVKSVGRVVVSLGFPQNALGKYFNKKQLTEVDEKQLLITGYSLRREDYQQWLESLPLTERSASERQSENEQMKSPQPIGNEGVVLASLRDFRVERSTPMDCLLFIVALQKQLDGSL
jgi:hypothetical protein